LTVLLEKEYENILSFTAYKLSRHYFSLPIRRHHSTAGMSNVQMSFKV